MIAIRRMASSASYGSWPSYIACGLALGVRFCTKRILNANPQATFEGAPPTTLLESVDLYGNDYCRQDYKRTLEEGKPQDWA